MDLFLYLQFTRTADYQLQQFDTSSYYVSCIQPAFLFFSEPKKLLNQATLPVSVMQTKTIVKSGNSANYCNANGLFLGHPKLM